MKILVYGAGVLGSLYASRLQEAGHEVWLLARGKRLADLRQHGIVLVDIQTSEETVSQVPLTERLEADDAYDLVLVIMRKNQVKEILPALAANQHTPSIDQLYTYFDPEMPPMAEGSCEIPMDCSQVWLGVGVLVGLAAVVTTYNVLSIRRVKP